MPLLAIFGLGCLAGRPLGRVERAGAFMPALATGICSAAPPCATWAADRRPVSRASPRQRCKPLRSASPTPLSIGQLDRAPGRPCRRRCALAGPTAASRRRFGPATVSKFRQDAAFRLFGGRRSDHRRHRFLGPVRNPALFRAGYRRSNSCSACIGRRRRPSGPTRSAPRAPSASSRWSRAPSHHAHRHRGGGPFGLSRRSTWPNMRRRRMRAVAKPMLEILAGMPTVVLGFFAALTVAPLVRGWGEALGL